MTQRLIGLILGAGTGLLVGGQLMIAADRIDLFDTKANRTGYIIVDPKTKRFDTYDRNSKRGVGDDHPGVRRRPGLGQGRESHRDWDAPVSRGEAMIQVLLRLRG
jgi:hypothetical protein